ncbi:redoxin domain-containing protein [Emticicia sp. ODNR4P]|nr:redoxin domain-containing protein [Emticicia sp. ODNR4P]
MKYTLSLLILLVFFAFAGSAQNGISTDTVEIISKLKPGEKAYLYYYNQFQEFPMPIEFNQTKKIKIAFRDLLIIKDTEKQMSFPITNSEKLYVIKDAEKITRLVSDNKNRTNELAFLVPIIASNQDFFAFGKSLDYRSIWQKIDAANAKNVVSPSYIEILKNHVYSNYLTLIASNYLYPEGKNTSGSAWALLEKEKVAYQNESLLKDAQFRNALINYEKVLLKKVMVSTTDFGSIEQSISSNFKGKIKDFLLFTFLCRPQKQDANFDAALQNYLNTSQNKEYIEYLKEKYLNGPKVKNGNLLSDKNESISLDEILKQHKGKVIYLDFWASWCAPCRQEIPDSKKLIASYQAKGLQVITISMDENKVAWQKALKAEDLSLSANYLLSKDFGSELAQKYKIKSIPRYMIIDKNGKFINTDAPRPSDPKLKELFDDLVKR